MTDYYDSNWGSDVYIPRPKYTLRCTAADVRALRDERGCGLMEAKRILERQQILEDLNKGRRSQDTVLLYDILEYMIENRHV